MRKVDGLCGECGAPTSSHAGNPGEWPVELPHPRRRDGLMRQYHVKCVLEWRMRADVTPDLAGIALAAMAGTGVATPLEGYLKVPHELAANIRALAKERDELKLVLSDVLEGKGIGFTSGSALARIRALVRADGCPDCAFPRNSIVHHHHVDDRAHAYRTLLGPSTEEDLEASRRQDLASVTPREALLRLLDLVIKDR